MQVPKSPTRYGAVAQSFHWIIVLFIIGQFFLAPIPDVLPAGMPAGVKIEPPFGLDKAGLLALHMSLGTTVLMLMILRLFWRQKNSPPPLPAAMKVPERSLAHASHIAFYVILFAMPLSGWFMTAAKGSSVSWFGLFTLPNFIGKNERAFDLFRGTHDILSKVLFALAILHVLAALKHHFWNKDDVLVRMLPFTRSK